MPLTTIEANAEGERTAYILGAGANKVVAVNYPHDDAVTFIERGSANGTQTYKTASLPSGAAVLQKVDSIMKGMRYSANASQRCYQEFNGGASQDCGVDHDPGVTWTAQWHGDINRPGGGAWQVADIGNGANCLRLGVKATCDATGGVRCTSLWFDVHWLYGAGGFALHVASWLPPLLAVASHAVSQAELVRFFHPRGKAGFEAFQVRPVYGGC
jgi:hypothetical protein